MNQYRVFNTAFANAAFTPVTTGSATLKTLLQLKGFNPFKVAAWGLSFDGTAAGAPVKCELLTTGTVFATVTALADADISRLGLGQTAASVMGLTLGTSASGFTSSGEGTVTAAYGYDYELVPPTNQYSYQFPLGEEPCVAVGDALRIRVNNPGTAVNCLCWLDIIFGG